MKKRREFFGANWKMHKNLAQSLEYFRRTEPLKWSKEKEIVFFVPSLYLLPIKEKSSLNLGVQNFYYTEQGAYTGEISAWMLKEEIIQYAILGHSERRQIFKEEDAILQKKLIEGLNKGLRIVFCIGETLSERESGKHFEIIEKQLDNALKTLPVNDPQDLILAYEPVWAIGTGKNATPLQAEEMHRFIRERIKNIVLPAEEIRIIYGGSVKPENIHELMSEPNIDGALVGGASLDPSSFWEITEWEKK